ncbi:MAG TPA: MFS transporter, partial [bacterium]|nr:MFS transporter [bacterium]
PGRDRAPIWLVLGSLLFLRGAMGLLQAPFFPVTAGGTTRRWFPACRWALANSLQNVTFTLASAAAAPLLVWLIARFGWRAGLMSAAPLALTLAALWWWDTRDDPATHPRVNAAEVELIRAGAPTSATGSTATWLDVVRNRDVALLTLSYFSLNYVFYLFFNWFYCYLTEVRQIPPMMAGYFTGAQWIVGAAGAATGGVLCDWLSVRLGSAWGCRLTAMAGILVATPCLLLGVTAASPVVVVTLLSLSFASTQLVDPAYWVAAMRVAGPRAPLATGILNTGGNLSGSLAAILVPVIAGAWGWTAGVGSGVVFAVVAALLWLGVRADRPIAT